jgi:uncharacterized protein YbjT (DUF2867 family)
MANDVILVVGATGNTGAGVVAGLLGQGRTVRALVRDAAKAEGLKSQGTEVVMGDLDDAATLTSALFADVSRVYLLTWNGPTATQQSKNFLGAMKAAGASPRIVRLSAYGAAHAQIIKDLRVAEQDLKDSGVEWTILQPTFFMQNTMMAAQSVQEMGMVFFDWGDGKAGMIDVRDIIDSVVGALTTDGDEFVGKEYVMTGPASIGFADVAASIGKVVGKEVTYVAVPHEKAKEAMLGMGLLESIADGFGELAEGFTDGFADLTTDSVQQLAGHAPRSFDEFASDFRSAFGG